MRRLLVNADGFGFTPGINRAIDDVCAAGFVRSTSVDANFPAVEALADFVARHPHVSVGAHLNLTVGRPVLPPERVPTLVDADGCFSRASFATSRARRALAVSEVEAELDAQIARIASFGARVTHWDSHQGVHVHEPFLSCAIRAARRAHVDRMRTHDYWLPGSWRERARYLAQNPKRVATFAGRRAVGVRCRWRGFRMADRSILLGVLPGTEPHRLETWLNLLRTLPQGTSEVWCHPGYPDDELRRHATLVETRAAEAEALVSPRLVEAAGREGVELIGFGAL